MPSMPVSSGITLCGLPGVTVSDMVGGSTAEHDDMEQRVHIKTVSSVHREASSFTSSLQTRDNVIIPILDNGKNLTSVFGRDNTTNWKKRPSVITPFIKRRTRTVVADCWTGMGSLVMSTDGGSFRNTRQLLVEDFSKNIGVILFKTNTTTLANFNWSWKGNRITRS